jgi:hypothetical protein
MSPSASKMGAVGAVMARGASSRWRKEQRGHLTVAREKRTVGVRVDMNDYPDNPNAVIKALRRALFTLCEQRRFDEAADYALSLKEPVIRYSPVESVADQIFGRRAADALELYRVALRSAREHASDATSGAEGLSRMVEVNRLEKKLTSRSRGEKRKSAAKAKSGGVRTSPYQVRAKAKGKPGPDRKRKSPRAVAKARSKKSAR